MSEKNRQKYEEWRNGAMLGKEGLVFVTKYQGSWIYVYRNHNLPILSLKILVDKGSGFEQIATLGEGVNQDSDCSLVIKDFNKLIFRDADGKLHPYGLKKAKQILRKSFYILKFRISLRSFLHQWKAIW